MDVFYLYDRDFMLAYLWGLSEKFTNDYIKFDNLFLCSYNSQGKSKKWLNVFHKDLSLLAFWRLESKSR